MSLIPRGLAATAVAMAVTGMFAPPASSNQALAAQLSVFLSDVLLGADSNGTVERMTVGTSEPVTATHLKIEIGSTNLAGVATVTVSGTFPECTTSGAVLTCIFNHEHRIDKLLTLGPDLVVKPVPGGIPVPAAPGKRRSPRTA